MQFSDRIDDTDKLREEIDRHLPLTGKALSQVRDHFRFRLTWASSALEGNCLTAAETRVILEEGITIEGKPSKDQREVVGHAEAFDTMWQLTRRAEITEQDIQTLHELLYRYIDPSNAGCYRRQNITFPGTDTVFPPPSEVKDRMTDFVAGTPRLRAENHPIVFAALLHTRLLTIHPFLDGNGRVGRLLMNLALLRADYPVSVFRPELRGAYLAAIREGDVGNVAPLVNLLSGMVWESQRDTLRLLGRLVGSPAQG